jgi:hypothetical protein
MSCASLAFSSAIFAVAAASLMVVSAQAPGASLAARKSGPAPRTLAQEAYANLPGVRLKFKDTGGSGKPESFPSIYRGAVADIPVKTSFWARLPIWASAV